MAEELEVKELDQVVVRFSGDSGDGMQLAGNIFSTVSATVGNSISTFPDYPADIRAPQGSLTGVSGFQVHIGASKVYTPGDECDVLVAMNAAALKTQYRYAKPNATIIIDTDSFGESDLKKAAFETQDYLGEMGIDPDRVIQCPITTIVKEALTDTGMDNKAMLKCRNMFALGLVCWLFSRDLDLVANFLREKFAKKPAIAEANIKVIQAGYDYGHNTHSSATNVYRIESKEKTPGRYMDITGNKATAYGFIAAAEKAGLKLYLGSYPITPATDVLHELSKHKSLGVTTVQCEDEIAGCASSLGAAFAGALAVTSTSGPGICLKSEAMNLAVIMELPLVVLDVQRPLRHGKFSFAESGDRDQRLLIFAHQHAVLCRIILALTVGLKAVKEHTGQEYRFDLQIFRDLDRLLAECFPHPGGKSLVSERLELIRKDQGAEFRVQHKGRVPDGSDR